MGAHARKKIEVMNGEKQLFVVDLFFFHKLHNTKMLFPNCELRTEIVT